MRLLKYVLEVVIRTRVSQLVSFPALNKRNYKQGVSPDNFHSIDAEQNTNYLICNNIHVLGFLS